MKNKIIYSTIFLAAFLIVTLVIYLLNEHYTNIFRFDFSARRAVSKISSVNPKPVRGSGKASAAGLSLSQSLQNKSLPEIVTKYDTVFIASPLNDKLLDSLKMIRKMVENIMNKRSVKKVAAGSSLTNKKKDEEWLSQTAKLFESMDPKKAAKIIQKYSDNESREILYKIKRKQAAAILSELSPDAAKRYTEPL